MEGIEREAGIATQRTELTSLFISYTSCSPSVPFQTTLPDQSGPIRDHSRREGSRKRMEGEQEKQERKKDVSV